MRWRIATSWRRCSLCLHLRCQVSRDEREVSGARRDTGRALVKKGWLASGMTHQEITSDYPELTEDDIRACLAYAADRERRILIAA